jgi:hypothetical protein
MGKIEKYPFSEVNVALNRLYWVLKREDFMLITITLALGQNKMLPKIKIMN